MCIAQKLEGPSKSMKQIIQIKYNKAENHPNWREANQLAIHKRGLGLELGTPHINTSYHERNK